MKKLLVLLLTVLTVIGLSGCGSKSDKKVVGILQLVTHDALDAATKGFKDELIAEFGEDGIIFDEQNAAGEISNCAVMAQNLVSEKCDLILADATPALQAVTSATKDIPVLGTAVTEYGIALDKELVDGCVGGNVSGTSDLANLEQQADIILELVPNAKTVGILYTKAEKNSQYQFDVVSKYLVGKGINVVDCPLDETNSLSLVVEDLCAKVDAIFIPTDNAAASAADTIDLIARPSKTPIICGEEGVVVKCGVATQTISYYELGIITGKMAGQILRGEADISTMPIAYYSDFYEETKKFNKTIADELGIVVPDTYEAID